MYWPASYKGLSVSACQLGAGPNLASQTIGTAQSVPFRW